MSCRSSAAASSRWNCRPSPLPVGQAGERVGGGRAVGGVQAVAQQRVVGNERGHGRQTDEREGE